MELSRKEEYRNQKVSIGVTLFSFIVMLLFFIYTNVINAGSSLQKTTSQEIVFSMDKPNEQGSEPNDNNPSATSSKLQTAPALKEISTPEGEVIPFRTNETPLSDRLVPAESHVTGTNLPGTDAFAGLKGDANFGYDLGNRSLLSFPRFESDTREEGRVVVDVVVNKNGEVIEADPNGRGTSTSSNALRTKARKMALATKFSPDQKTEEQKGTLTITFSFN